jgi:hydroxymethylglutaryl-CoA reductase
MGNPTAQ